MSLPIFPTAMEYMTAGDLPRIGDATIDMSKQPAYEPPRDRGRQPVGFLNKDVKPDGTRRKILVVGAGDVWDRFARAPLEHRGSDVYIFDPALQPVKGLDSPDETIREAAQQKESARQARMKALNLDEAHCVLDNGDGYPKVPEGTEAVVVLTPPKLHVPYIQWAQDHGIPAIVEKPLVNDVAEFAGPHGLDEIMKHAKVPIYCMDWKAAHAAPLAALVGLATGVSAPHQDILGDVPDEVLKKFDFKHIRRAEGVMMQLSTESGDMTYLKEKRKAVWEGGVLSDMGVHPMAALANMGFTPTHAIAAELGDTEGQQTPGIYRRIGNGQQMPAWYARGKVMTEFQGQQVPMIIEVGKGGGVVDNCIRLIDKNGSVLKWNYDNKNSANTITLTTPDGVTTEIHRSNVNPYALMFDEALHFFDKQKEAPQKSALYYHEQKAIIKAVNDMERIGRERPADELRQFALAPNATIDMSQAHVTARGPEIQR